MDVKWVVHIDYEIVKVGDRRESEGWDAQISRCSRQRAYVGGES